MRFIIEEGTPAWEQNGWEIFWKYFVKQWIPILSAWNIRQDDGSIIPKVNRINNALECYNRHYNSLFSKIPNIIEWIQITEKESRYQAEKLDNIHSGKKVEIEQNAVWVPEIPILYGMYKASNYIADTEHTTTTPTKKKKNKTSQPAEHLPMG